jgi:hypothetical protein
MNLVRELRDFFLLLDKKGKWVENLEVTEKLWKEMMEEIITRRIPKLLDCAERLLHDGGDESICAGLYTYAIEEYGKLLLLKQYSPVNGKIHIEYRYHFRNHEPKFEIVIRNLPKECTTLRKGVFDSGVFDKKIFDVGQIADFEARLTTFYSDFTDSAVGIRSVPSVDKDCLQNAIKQFKISVSNFH